MWRSHQVFRRHCRLLFLNTTNNTAETAAPSSSSSYWRYCDFYILPFLLKIAYSWPFWGSFGCIFPQIWSPIVLTPKRTILARKHVVWAINRENRSGEKKGKNKTGQERTGQSKEAQGGNISPIWGEARTLPSETKIGMVGNLADVITCEIFRGYTGSNFSFSYRFLHGPYNTAALLSCLLFSVVEFSYFRSRRLCGVSPYFTIMKSVTVLSYLERFSLFLAVLSPRHYCRILPWSCLFVFVSICRLSNFVWARQSVCLSVCLTIGLFLVILCFVFCNFVFIIFF